MAPGDLGPGRLPQRLGMVMFYGAVRGNFLQLGLGEQKTLFEGVYQVGVSEFSNLKKVKLNRVDPVSGKTEIKIINVEKVKQGDRSEDILLQDGDRIEVPEKTIIGF